MQIVKLVHFTEDGREKKRESVICPRRQALPAILEDHFDGGYIWAFSPTGRRIATYPKDTRGGARPCPSHSVDGIKRPHRITIRMSDDVWNILQRQTHRADFIHCAIRFYFKNKKP